MQDLKTKNEGDGSAKIAFQYPEARRDATVEEDYHGTKVSNWTEKELFILILIGSVELFILR